MKLDVFITLLGALRPTTLAHLAVDLEEAAADWETYPENAPDAATQQALTALHQQVVEQGGNRAAADRQDFDELLAQVRDERDQENWLVQRNRQTRQNWFEDYQ